MAIIAVMLSVPIRRIPKFITHLLIAILLSPLLLSPPLRLRGHRSRLRKVHEAIEDLRNSATPGVDRLKVVSDHDHLIGSSRSASCPETRNVLGLSISAALNREIEDTRFGVFRM